MGGPMYVRSVHLLRASHTFKNFISPSFFSVSVGIFSIDLLPVHLPFLCVSYAVSPIY